jgi:phosphatidylglycerol:prolipoprotein diacylglycerol transferase
MHPILFEIGPFTIASYGVCLCIAFLINYPLFISESKRRNIPSKAVDYIFFAAILGGMVGGKLLYLFESTLRGNFSVSQSLSLTGGFAANGGFLLAFGFALAVIHHKKYSAGEVFNAVAPGLALAYGIARIGCQLSGDGDYGIPSDLPWAMAYPNGIVPTLVNVHPTPVYETIMSFLAFALLWKLRVKLNRPFELFAWYLILSGTSRFLVEFIRLNPELAFGLTSSQFLALTGIVVAIIILLQLNRGHTQTQTQTQ